VMDNGTLTDHNGKKIDFRNVIIIMTTNAGARDLSKSAIGFGRETDDTASDEAIKQMFSPEFRNRLDATVPFGFLPPEVVELVVEKFILQLELQLTERNVDISLDAEAMAWIAKKGYDKSNGARPLSRVIQEHIKKPLADELLFGKLAKGGEIVIKVKKDKLTFEITAKAPTPTQANKTGPKTRGKPSETVK